MLKRYPRRAIRVARKEIGRISSYAHHIFNVLQTSQDQEFTEKLNDSWNNSRTNIKKVLFATELDPPLQALFIELYVVADQCLLVEYEELEKDVYQQKMKSGESKILFINEYISRWESHLLRTNEICAHAVGRHGFCTAVTPDWDYIFYLPKL